MSGYYCLVRVYRNESFIVMFFAVVMNGYMCELKSNESLCSHIFNFMIYLNSVPVVFS